jgi:hypothetical protein
MEDVDWSDLAQDRDQWPEPVNMIMNLCILYSVGDVFSS